MTKICGWCGRSFEDHEDSRPSDAPVPRVPCLLLKSGFREKPMAPSKTMRVAREWAIFRHRILWCIQGSHPDAWPAHMFWIKAVYGY